MRKYHISGTFEVSEPLDPVLFNLFRCRPSHPSPYSARTAADAVAVVGSALVQTGIIKLLSGHGTVTDRIRKPLQQKRIVKVFVGGVHGDAVIPTELDGARLRPVLR